MGTNSVKKFYMRGCLWKSRNKNLIVSKFVGKLNGQKYVLSRVFPTHECGWCGPRPPAIWDDEGHHDEQRPPSIRANIAVDSDETASASHRYGQWENGASSLSARRTIWGRFCVFARHDRKINYYINNVRTRNDTRVNVVNNILKYC